MAYLQTTYIDGDLFVQNALNVKEIKIDSGSFVPKIEGGDADYDGLLDNFDKKLVIFNGDEGTITKSPISLGDGVIYDKTNSPITELNDDAAPAKVLYDLSLQNYSNTTMGYPLGLMLNNISSENFVIKNTPIYLHEDSTPTWNYTFEGSVQDVIYQEASHYDLTCVVKSTTSQNFLGIAFTVLHNTIGNSVGVNPTIRNGYSVESWVLDNITLNNGNIFNNVNVTESTPDSLTINDKGTLEITLSNVDEDKPYILYCNVQPTDQEITIKDSNGNVLSEITTNVETKVIFGESAIKGKDGSYFELLNKDGIPILANSFEVYSNEELIATYAPGVEIVLPYNADTIKVISD